MSFPLNGEVRVYFRGTVPAWLRLQRERYWAAHQQRRRPNPFADITYLAVFLRLPP